MPKSKSWLDKMVRRVRDADTDEEAKEVTKDYIDPTGATGALPDDDGDTHIHLHMGKNGEGGEMHQGDDEPPIDVGGGGEPDIQQLAASVAELLQRVEQLEQGGGDDDDDDGEDVELEDPDTKDKRRFRMRRGTRAVHDDEEIPNPDRNPDMIYETDLPGIEDLDKRMSSASSSDKRRFRDRYLRTTDSADAETVWSDVMASAEILQPGVRIPTFDARLSLESTGKRLCAFRRRVLDHALAADDTAEVLHEVVGTIDANALSCDSVKMAFNAAAAHIKLLNNRGSVRRTAGTGTNDSRGVSSGPPSLSQMNKNSRDFWKKQPNGQMH